MSAPSRDDTPDRRDVRALLDHTLFVEAGAGTGKTTALVARIVQLVLTSQASINEIAAITFTEKAAGELRDRVREAFELVAAGTWIDEHVDPPTDAQRVEQVAHARGALTDVDAAAITTLHGFAARILQQFPFDAGLPPRIQTLDEVTSALAFSRRWSRFLDELLDDPTAGPLLVEALLCGITLTHLRDLAQELNDNWDLVADHHFVEPGPVPIDASEIVSLLGKAAAASAACSADNDVLAAHIRRLAPFVQRLADAAADPHDTLRLLVNAPALKNAHGTKKNWGEGLAEARQLTADAQALRDELVSRVIHRTIASLLGRIAALTLDAATERRQEGTLEFHDLLVLSRDLLRSHPDVCEALRLRYRHLLIDEFQDTDPIQAELAVRIAVGAGAAPGQPWQELAVEPGRLFFVGDAKQAIYRFRRADIGLFLDMQQRFGQPTRSLTTNRRSVPGIIDWVNEVFTRLIGDGEDRAQPLYQSLVHHRVPHPGGVPVAVLGGPSTGALHEIREAEGADIARTCRRAVDQAWAIGPEARPARLADITVLVPGRTVLPAIEEAFNDLGVPYRLDSASLVYSSIEVQELLSVARAVDDPTNDVAVVAALRSSLFGCGDDDLLTFHQHRTTWNYLAPAPDPEVVSPLHPVIAGMGALRKLHDERTWLDVSQLLRRILRQRRVMELALDSARPRDVWRRLSYVVDQARSFTDTAGNDLRAWLAWVELLGSGEHRISDAVLPETDDDAVRVMTIHAAKGLEFPVVIVTGLNVAPRAATGVQVFWPDGVPLVGLKVDLAMTGYGHLRERERTLDGFERVRLLYVATTRAMDHLVLSLHHKEVPPGKASPNQAHALHEVIADFPQLWRTGDAPAPTAPTAPTAVAPLPDTEPELHPPGPFAPCTSIDGTDAGREAWISARSDRLDAVRPTTISATAVAKALSALAADEPGLDKDAPDLDLPPWHRGRAGTAIGRAVHGSLQLVDFENARAIDAIAASQAAAEGVAEHATRIASLVRAGLDAAIVRTASSAPHWRELYVGVPIGGQVLEGFVDLLVDDPVAGLTIVDYKTDALDDTDLEGSLAAKLVRYRAQGACYAIAIEEATGRPVRRCVFVFLRAGGPIERDLADLADAKAEVRAFLGAVTTGG